MSARIICCLLWLSCASLTRAQTETAFWVWNRTDALKPDEISTLQAQSVRTLYWHAGEITVQDGAWRWIARVDQPALIASPFHTVAVIRFTRNLKPPFGSPEELVAMLQTQLRGEPLAELQIDFDCPDRLLGEFARFASATRQLIPHLSITALAHWIDLPEWKVLEAAADEIVPMFYDLEQDPLVGSGRWPLPLANSDNIGPQLARWSRCMKPWRAGFPCFARLSVYDRTGKSRGHIRNFDWADVCFDKALLSMPGAHLGATLLRAASRTVIAGTLVERDEFLAARWPDRQALAAAIAMAEGAGARGIVWFRLPEAANATGWSLRQLGSLKAAEEMAEPMLVLVRGPDARLVLSNRSGVDLPPRLQGDGGPRDRGFALELDARAPIFREVLAGDFWKVAAHVAPEGAAKPVPVPLATRVTLWFSHLRAGESLRTALVTLAPGANFRDIRYRILHSPGDSAWRQLP